MREVGKEENKHTGELEHGDRWREKEEKEGSVSVMQRNNENMLLIS